MIRRSLKGVILFFWFICIDYLLICSFAFQVQFLCFYQTWLFQPKEETEWSFNNIDWLIRQTFLTAPAKWRKKAHSTIRPIVLHLPLKSDTPKSMLINSTSSSPYLLFSVRWISASTYVFFRLSLSRHSKMFLSPSATSWPNIIIYCVILGTFILTFWSWHLYIQSTNKTWSHFSESVHKSTQLISKHAIRIWSICFVRFFKGRYPLSSFQ